MSMGDALLMRFLFCAVKRLTCARNTHTGGKDGASGRHVVLKHSVGSGLTKSSLNGVSSSCRRRHAGIYLSVCRRTSFAAEADPLRAAAALITCAALLDVTRHRVPRNTGGWRRKKNVRRRAKTSLNLSQCEPRACRTAAIPALRRYGPERRTQNDANDEYA